VKLKKLRYKIDNGNWGLETVDGYAIDFGSVRICVHKGSIGWTADHYDSGLRFGFIHDNMTICANQAIAIITEKLRSGDYEKALRKEGYLS
jgi:hypothetical protein